MSPSIDLSAATFSRLQSHAVPLVDTIESVINKLIDHFEKEASSSASANGSDGQSVRMFNPNTPPDLTHAKILGVTFCGKSPGRGQDNWNGLLNMAVREARACAKSDAEFNDLMVINHVSGDKQDEGYRPLPGTGISVQGQDANGAWRAIAHIAQKLGCQVSVKFAWREKEGAAFPGITGQFAIEGK